MVLEATSTSDIDKSLIKAATQNRLGYESIRTALLRMHEDLDRHPHAGFHPKGRGHGKGFRLIGRRLLGMRGMSMTTPITMHIQLNLGKNMNGRKDTMARAKTILDGMDLGKKRREMQVMMQFLKNPQRITL